MPYATGTQASGTYETLSNAMVSAGWTLVSAGIWESPNTAIRLIWTADTSTTVSFTVLVNTVNQGTFTLTHGTNPYTYTISIGPSWLFLRASSGNFATGQSLGCFRVSPYGSGEVDNEYVTFGPPSATEFYANAVLSRHIHNGVTHQTVPVRLAHMTHAFEASTAPSTPANTMTAVNGSPVAHTFVVRSPIGSGIVGALRDIYFLYDLNQAASSLMVNGAVAQGTVIYVAGKAYRALGTNEATNSTAYSTLGVSGSPSGINPTPTVLVREGV